MRVVNNRTRLLVVATGTAALASTVAARGHADCVVPPAPCEALARAEVVFHGEGESGGFLLSRERAGFVEVGMTVDELYRAVGRERTRLVDLFEEGM